MTIKRWHLYTIRLQCTFTSHIHQMPRRLRWCPIKIGIFSSKWGLRFIQPTSTLDLLRQEGKKVMLGTKFKRCVQHHELRATDCNFLGGFVRSNLSKPCAIPSITFLARGSKEGSSFDENLNLTRISRGVLLEMRIDMRFSDWVYYKVWFRTIFGKPLAGQ